MRADWYMPVFWERADLVIAAARAAGHRVFAIENTGPVLPWEVDLTGPSLFVVGGEAEGIPEAVQAQCDEVLRLPMAGFIPSYNLQAAVAVVSVERLRQLHDAERRARPR
jgi:tRNA G18 (ribose-2'-O)-methylase SpoU